MRNHDECHDSSATGGQCSLPLPIESQLLADFSDMLSGKFEHTADVCSFCVSTLTESTCQSELVDPVPDVDDDVDEEDVSADDDPDDELESLEELAVVLEVLEAEPPDFELSVL